MTTEQPDQPLTASQRLALAMGRPIPQPMTEKEIREWEAKQDKIDAEIERFYRDEPGAPAA
jgi:hypothetical protein